MDSNFSSVYSGPERRRRHLRRSMRSVEDRAVRWMSTTPLPILIALVVLISVWPRMGAWEGSLMPAASQMHITDSRISRGARLVAFEFDDLRGCGLIAVEWHWEGPDSDYHAIPHRVGVTNGIRTIREDRVRRTVMLETKLSNEHLHATAIHECHPLWLTRTRIHP